MNTGNWLLMLLPILAFAIVDWKMGPVKAAVAAMVIGLMAVTADYFLNGYLDEMMLIELALIVSLGLLTVKSSNPAFVRQQPTITDGFFAIFLAAFQISGTPLLVKYIPRLEKITDHTTQSGQLMIRQIHDPRFVAILAQVSYDLIFVFLIHGAIMLVTGMKSSRKVWVICRLLIYPMAFVDMGFRFAPLMMDLVKK